jgi:choline dehydrogenase-like flavoprotein
VADASQLPEAPGVNPQLGVMAHAARAADAFLAASDAQARRRAARDDA